MALPTRVQGARRPGLIITWLRDDETAENLTDATVTGRIRDRNTGAARDISGAITLTDPAAGVFSWLPSVEDVSAAGLFEVQFTATFSSGATPARTFSATWTLTAAI